MLAAETPDIDALESSDAAEVLDLYSGEIPYCIGDRVGAEASELEWVPRLLSFSPESICTGTTSWEVRVATTITSSSI